MQWHAGDLGWFWRFGADATAPAVRAWNQDGQILAVGLSDGDDLLRLAVAPTAARDGELARQVVRDLTEAKRGVLTAGQVSAEFRWRRLR